MNFCTNCGAERVVGRFCTNCGAPSTAAATPAGDTAERPAVGRAAPPAPAAAGGRAAPRWRDGEPAWPCLNAGVTTPSTPSLTILQHEIACPTTRRRIKKCLTS